MTTAAAVRAMRNPRHWMQLLRFCAVGASGYVVNLAVFALCVHALDLDDRLAAVAAFLVAVTNNFAWNRVWTFDSPEGRRRFQALRFLAVSIGAFLFGAVILEALVSGAGADPLPAQAVSIVCATPLSFLGNKLWSFRGR